MTMVKVKYFLQYLDYQRIKNLYNPNQDYEFQLHFFFNL